VAADSRKAAADGETFHEIFGWASECFLYPPPLRRIPPHGPRMRAAWSPLGVLKWAGELSDTGG
jgi:hypothetical protein